MHDIAFESVPQKESPKLVIEQHKNIQFYEGNFFTV